jgi:tetratricopeptide (TPR) repeat protein
MSPVRRRSRAELPSSPIEFAYPIAVPDGTVFGAVIIREVPHSFALHVFHALRMTMAWAAGPEASGIEFDTMDLWEWELEVLQTEGVDEALWAPVSVIAGELTRPALLEPERLAHACLAVMDWALGAEAHGTALLFAEAAAVVWPSNARLAWICGKAHRERHNFVRAETWLKRAKRVAVWTGDWEMQSLALNSLGNIKMWMGDLEAARELLLQAGRIAKARRLRERHAKVLHDLFLVCIYSGEWKEAERYAEQAFAAYGPDHPNIIALTFDLALLATHQGQFARALEVLNQLRDQFTGDDRRLRVYAMIARASGAAGDAETFQSAWTESWALIDGNTVDHLRADAALELGLGAIGLGFRDHAMHALVIAREAAKELGERDTLHNAESALAKLEYHEAAAVAARNRPAVRTRAAELAAKYILVVQVPTGGNAAN